MHTIFPFYRILKYTAATATFLFFGTHVACSQSAGAAMSGGSGAGSQNPLIQLNRLQREIDRTNPTNRSGLEKLTIAPQLLYFTGGWATGTVSAPAASPAAAVQTMRYNVVLQQLEIQDTSQPNGFRALTPDVLPGFSISGPDRASHQFAAKPYYNEAHVQQRSFFEVLASGNIQLLILHEFYIQPAEYVAAYNVESKPEEYRRITRLFAGTPAKEAVYELALTKQTVLKLFEKDARTELAAYATTNHLAYSDVNDVLKLVTYYNSMHPTSSTL
ncbi:hypothetical protein [Hymenobacter rigui]|uniref:DUF4476 domain-containing protein n=1 Tax=Hymenobacter rigui TaxID=334424 RepID=A0A428KVT6_9BACT|nr:hypothetical protein [Hymenobacter rigui]RSK50818.1 hypothetical protein EI291_00410 [Hymenobacter rigui]